MNLEQGADPALPLTLKKHEPMRVDAKNSEAKPVHPFQRRIFHLKEKLQPQLLQDFLDKHSRTAPPEYLDSYIIAVKNEPERQSIPPRAEINPGAQYGEAINAWYNDIDSLVQKL